MSFMSFNIYTWWHDGTHWRHVLILHATVGVSIATVYPKKYAHGFVVLCFVVVMQSFIMNSHEVFIHIHQACFAGTGAIVRLPQCQWSKPDGYGKISQCITITKHSKAKTVCIFLGIYCNNTIIQQNWCLQQTDCQLNILETNMKRPITNNFPQRLHDYLPVTSSDDGFQLT